MTRAGGAFTVEIIDSLDDLDAIREEYIALFERARAPSLFCSFQFVRTDWVHFHGESDRLFLLAIRDARQLVGIAPFVIEPEMLLSRFPFRVIKFITEWGDGDKPRIVTTLDDALMWGVIERFLSSDFRAWDAIALDEQPPDSGVLAPAVFRTSSFLVRRTPGVWSYRAAIGGGWTDYVAALKGKVRGDWARCKRRLSEHAQPLRVECFEGVDDIGQALERYVALERKTWKGGASFSIGGKPEQLAFYTDLVQQLAPAGMVAICFLISGPEDGAANMVFRGGGTVYGAHICYDPSLAKFSPGVILNAEVMKRHFDSGYRFFDFLALQGGDSDSRFKAAWATESQELAGINIYKRGLRLLLYRVDQRWRRVQKRARVWRRGG